MKIFTKLILVFCLTIFTQNVISQTNWNENFVDSNFTFSPEWTGDTADFVVDMQKKLQLNAPAVAGQSILQTASTAAIESQWEFSIQFDFNPSTSNYAEVFLMSTAANSQGYFVRIGGSSSDQVSLYKKQGVQNTALVQSAIGFINANQINLHIKVTRDAANNWTLFADSTGGNTFISLGNAVDSTFTTSDYFSVHCHYTSTRSDKFWFDNISVNGKEFVDSIAPKITAHFFPNWQQIDLQFSEAVDSISAVTQANYTLLNSGNVLQQIVWQPTEPNLVQLQYNQTFGDNVKLLIDVKNITDNFGNSITDTVINTTFSRPSFRQVVFNEIMADPSPVIGLPDIEYVEIYNKTKNDIHLEGWKLVAEQDTFILNAQTIFAHGYALFVSKNESTFYDTINQIVINASSGWLKNDGEPLLLIDENDEIIDAFSYNSAYYQNPAKTDGGWSLAQITDTLPCSESSNWAASANALGGSPGNINRTDTSFKAEPTAFVHATWLSPRNIKITFNQGVDETVLQAISSNIPIQEIDMLAHFPNAVLLKLSTDIIGQQAQIYLDNKPACIGTFLADTLSFSAPESLEKGDLVLNEILFNPGPNGTDFIEIWNVSSKTILLSDLFLANFNNEYDATKSFRITEEYILMAPKSFRVFSINKQLICALYNCPKPKYFLDIPEMPSMPSNVGIVGIVLADLTPLDFVSYDEKWHHDVINNSVGVSLERIHPSLPSNKETSWHSASSSANYATPGQINSQFSTTATNQKNIWLNNNSLSPNNDGRNDVLIVYYDLPLGSALTVNVFGTNGVLIHTIAENYITDKSGQLLWHGKGNEGQVASAGVYIIMAEWFTPDGNKGVAKLTVAVSQR